MASFYLGVHIVCMNSSKRSLNFESCFIGADPLPPQPPVLVIILNPPDPARKLRQGKAALTFLGLLAIPLVEAHRLVYGRLTRGLCDGTLSQCVSS